MAPTTAGPEPVSGAAFSGMVHGGEQPVVGAQIELFAAGSNGNAQGATSLLRNPVFKTAGGTFSITGDCTCPDASSEIYLMAVGGNPGLASGTNNSAITLVDRSHLMWISSLCCLTKQAWMIAPSAIRSMKPPAE